MVLALGVGMFSGCKEKNNGSEGNGTTTLGETTDSDSDNGLGALNGSNFSTNEGGYVIKGKLDNYKDLKQTVFLNQLIQKNVIRKDTATISENGEFIFEGRVEVPDFYQIVFSNGKFLVMVLDNQEVKFYADINKFDETKKISGSRDQDVFVAITTAANERNSNRTRLNGLMQEASKNQNQQEMDRITAEYMAKEEEAIKKMKSVLANSTDSYVAAMGATQFLDPNTDFEFMDSLSNVLNEKFPDSRYAMELFKSVNGLRNVSIGALAPNIILSDPEGKNRSLKDLRGKYVLIDFWASWCRPCRAENPNVVKMYADYKNKNFEIFGVSLDKSEVCIKPDMSVVSYQHSKVHFKLKRSLCSNPGEPAIAPTTGLPLSSECLNFPQ